MINYNFDDENIPSKLVLKVSKSIIKIIKVYVNLCDKINVFEINLLVYEDQDQIQCICDSLNLLAFQEIFSSCVSK